MGMVLTKSAILFGAMVAAFGIILPGPSKATPLEREPLVLGIAENGGDIPTLIALEQGFYRDEGLDVTTKSWPAGKMALEALLRDEVEVATVADTPLVLQSFKRQDFVIIATFSHNTPYRLVADLNDRIASPTDLRGHRVGVMAGTTAQFFLHSVLADLGIAPSEIIEVNVPADESADALVSDRVDAIAAFDPQGYFAQVALGSRAQLIPYEKGRHEETFNYATRRGFSKSRPRAAERLMRATNRAIEWAHTHREEAIALIAHRLKIDMPMLSSSWDNYRHALTLDQVLIISLESQARWAIRNNIGGGTKVPNYLNYLDTTPLDAVLPSAVTIIR